MAHRFVKWGVFLFFVLSVGVLAAQTDNFLENITGNVVLSEEVTEEIGEVIVVLKDPVEEGIVAMGDKSEEELGKELEIIREEVIGDLGVNGTMNLSSGGFVAEVNESVLKDLEEDPRVAFVEPVRYFDISLSEATAIINASDTWRLNISGQNLTGSYETVCVIDTGINYSHVDLAGRNMTACNLDCINQVCVENCSETDLNGHGTHVAGIVAASGVVTGVAPGVNYIGMKVFPDASRSGATTTGIKSAIDWCVDNSETYNISVITMSLGTAAPLVYDSSCDSEYPLFNASITNAYNKNISVTVSSGNEANTTHITSPACVSKAIPVADTYDANVGSVGWGSPLVCTDSATAVDQIVCHANRNSLVRLLAPGALIYSTWYDGGYDSAGGTSMAAPMVAGAIAVMNQYLNLSGQTKTPLELETVLDNTGKAIDDSGESGEIFSRINVYYAILSLDVDAPNVTLVSPTDNKINLTVNQTFICNATDWQLANMTLKVWNSSEILYYNATNNITGISNQTSFNLTNMSEDIYLWNCFGVDSLGNSDYASANFSLTIGGISTTLTSPSNATYTNTNLTNYTCRVRSEDLYELSNVTFYLWNSTGNLTYNFTEDISGLDNTTIFNYNFTEEKDYTWNCFGTNNASNSSWGASNFSVTYDITNPNLTITSSPVGATSSSIERSFGFNVSDTNLANCSLIVDDVISLTNSSMNSSIGQLFSQTFTPGTYAWTINCSDYAGNVNSSSENSFTITAPTITTGSDSPSGGGGSTTTTSPPVVEANESAGGGADEGEEGINDSNVTDEDTAEYFAHDEAPETGGSLFEVLTSTGSIVVVVLIIFGVVIVLHRAGILKKTKELKGLKTKEKDDKIKKAKA
ncbi:MAG: S8 family serine peptidase [Nanoarchaeota archaeon]|nr:S8 family serine peptidase [Nanoarchaeota archaeon]